MSRPLIDRLSDPVRRQMLTSLFYAPSLGALALAGGLVPVVVASGMFTAFALYASMRINLELRDLKEYQKKLPPDEVFGARWPAPAEAQAMADELRQEFGITKRVHVFLYPDEYPPAFATEDDEIGFSNRAYEMMNPGEVRWVIAHELAHIAKGDTQVNYPMLFLSKYMERLAAGIGGVSAMQAAGHESLALGGVAALSAAFVVAKARHYVDMYSSRSMERRRDYEATQTVGNPLDAIYAVRKVELLKEMDEMSLRERWLYTHPLGMARIQNIVNAYEDGVRRGLIAPPERAPAPAA